MAKIVYEISCAVIFNLLYTSMFSDGITLRPYPDNPIVGRHVAFECNTEIAIAGAVSIKIPNNTVIGSCIPASFPVSVSCSNLPGYKATLNESAHTLRINTSSMGSDLNGTWLCIHNAQTATYDLESPLTEIQDEFFNLSPTTFIQDITSESSISLTAAYGCINIPISFTWIVVDNSSKRIDLGGANKVLQNGSVCTAFSGFDAYTETKNVSDVYLSTSDKNLVGRHRLGVEVHYLGEVTALQSIQYFDTFFTFSSGGTSTPTGNKGIVFVMLFVCLLANYSMVDAVCFCTRSTANKYASETFRSQSCIRNGTVTPHETGKSQKKSTFDKRKQPDGEEGPQSTPKDPDARHLTTGRPLPQRPDTASPQTGPFDSVNSPRPIVLAPIENPNIPPSIDTLDEQKAER